MDELLQLVKIVVETDLATLALLLALAVVIVFGMLVYALLVFMGK